MKIKHVLFGMTLIAGMSCQSGETSNAGDAKVETQAEDIDYLHVPEGAKVYFVNLQDGDEVTSPFNVTMGVEGMELHPAGDLIQHSGHHHIIINGEFYEVGETIPMDEMNLHYGDAQEEAELELAPGDYVLTMQYANGHHQSYGEQMSAKVMITVVE
ncbi:MAG: DUF4399 domain-containing protein [Cryomorphaceae bacterium]|nr:DUF4399 domain-containing protein [Cryomorphaceae bacterium]